MTVMEERQDTTPRTYVGLARVLDLNGMLLDVGKANFEVLDPEIGTWRGTIRVFDNSCLEPRSLTCLVELADGSRAKAQVGPGVAEVGNSLIDVKVVGIDRAPF